MPISKREAAIRKVSAISKLICFSLIAYSQDYSSDPIVGIYEIRYSSEYGTDNGQVHPEYVYIMSPAERRDDRCVISYVTPLKSGMIHLGDELMIWHKDDENNYVFGLTEKYNRAGNYILRTESVTDSEITLNLFMAKENNEIVLIGVFTLIRQE